jgi:DNA-binding MarR family transcriptional regulator
MNIEDRIAVALRQINHALDLHSRRLLEEFGVTGPQLATLQAAARLGKVSAGALAKSVHVSQATVTGILDRLEHRGLITRTRDGQDRRSTFITVTDAGHHVLRSAPPPLQEQFRKQLSGLEDWEQTMMLATLLRIAAMMGADNLEVATVPPPNPETGNRPEHSTAEPSPAAVTNLAPPPGTAVSADEPSPAST